LLVYLSKNNYFVISKKDNNKSIKNFYQKDYTFDEKNYYIKANALNLEKLEKYVGKENLNKNCYLFPLLEYIKTNEFAPETKRTYMYINQKFLEVLNKVPNDIEEKDIERYLSILKRRKKSENTISVSYSALKMFYEKVMGKIDFSNIERPKPNLPISKILSRKEIKKIIESIQNPKHKLLIEIAYACGLKLQETVKLKINDINLKKGLICIKTGTNKRKIPISKSLLTELKIYLKNIFPKGKTIYLFFSDRNVSKHITTRAAEKIFKDSIEKANINRSLSFKSLRDSFVAHMLNEKVDKEIIKKILGIKKAQFDFKYKFLFQSPENLPDLLNFQDV
jgi:site-specific recombinase XerD